MINRKSDRLLASVLILWTAPALGGQALLQASDFSAEIVDTTRGDARPKITKLHVHGTHMRMIDATPDQKRDGSYMLIDYAARTAYAVMPSERTYMDLSAMLAQGELAWRFFHPRNPQDACSEWQEIFKAQQKTVTCKKVGSDTLNGRGAVKYEGVDSDSNKGSLWVDTRLGFLIKIQDQDHLTIWQDINEEPQPASLFEVPRGYQKVDLPGTTGKKPPNR